VDVFTAGSTAVEGSLRAYVRSICTNIDEYQVQNVTQTGAGVYSPSPSNQKQLLFLCTLNSGAIPGLTTGFTQLALRKSSGDSGEGLSGPTGKYAINFVPVVSAAFTCGAASTLPVDGSLAAVNQQTCNFSTSSAAYIAPTNGLAGVADVEPSILNTQLGGLVSGTQLSGINVDTIAATVWGVAATKVLRDKLQAVQNLSVGDDTEAYMPSLAKATLYSIFAGQLPDANSLTDANNNGITAAVTGTLGSAPATTNTALYFLRRPESSGTMTSFKAMFGNTPCVSSVTTWAGDGQAAQACDVTVTTGPVTELFQSTGNLLGCLKTVNDVTGGGMYGIGIASTSNNPIPANNTSKDAHWRWIKVNGVAPTLYNTATGRYDLYTEATFLTAKLGTLAPTGNGAAVIAALKGGLQSPTIIAKINSDNTAGNQLYGGFFAGLALTNATTQKNGAVVPTYPLSVANMNTNPVIPSTRNTANANSCQPVLQFGNTNIPVNQ
jgi:hypothetical protein